QEAPEENGSVQEEQEGEKIEIKMPKMGESVMEGTVIEWAKEVGDKVEEDETLLEISTDKVDSEVPSPEAGTLVEQVVQPEETVEVGETIAIIATGKVAEKQQPETGGTETEEKKEVEKQDTEEPDEAEAQKKAASANGSEPQRIGSDGRFYSPLVRSIAKEEGISQEELESIDGSGQGGRVAKQDILNYLDDRKSTEKTKEQPEEKPAPKEEKPKEKPAATQKEGVSAGQLSVERPDEGVEVVKMDRMRKMIAKHMVSSKQTSAHVTTFAEVDVTKMVNWRE